MVSLNPKIYIKIGCRHCGQKYAFDVYPLNNQMPSPVKCPICHTDGTAAANEILAQKLGGQPSHLPVANDEWQRRALEAEARAEQSQAALKASLAPQLAQSLKEAVVQELAAQRTELLKAQQSAVLEISELVRRLDELKVPLQERLLSYEARIRELEKDLAERNEENRELLKLKIEMIRRQLEAERASSRVDFN
jgi:hypothetical protein